ncbi:MAG: hypothetical protein HC849_22015 [Oscillatoriales cyanobacterium RU_3_3]|nr:hypothetical protein [Microcoleus sp. SU_5_6]NJL67568.1 hypothetical protein [Microcoleus sp. SM1_3_4]NJM62272.1 hypothetical protein [Oscillatoriales cyanobacterium RU_3_3]
MSLSHETSSAFTDESLASKSIASIDSSFHGDWFVVSTILLRKLAIALNSRSDGVELNNPYLPQTASTFGKIDTLKILCQDSPDKSQLGFTIHCLHPLKLQISQFSKWYSFLTQKDVALDCRDRADRPCYNVSGLIISHLWQSFWRFREQSGNSNLLTQADRNSDTLFEAKTRDRLSDNNTAILNCLRSGTDKTLLSLYCVPALQSTLEVLLA